MSSVHLRGGSRLQRLWLLVAVAALIAAACSSSPDESAESESPSSTAASAEADDVAAEAEAGTSTDGSSTVSASGWDIDTVLRADPNCAQPATGEPLRIGYAADLSEIGGQADRPATQGAEHMAKLINCSGGLDGRPIEFRVEDISGTPVESRAAILRLLEWGAHALLGPPFPDTGFRVLQVTNGQIPVIFTNSTEPALGDASSLSYLVAFNDTQGATVAADFALDNGWRRAVTYSSPGPYFGYLPLVFASVLSSGGGELIGDYEYIPFETVDFSADVAAIAADPPDVIYSGMFAEQTLALRDQLSAAGATEIEYLMTDSFEATGGYSLGGTDGIYHVTHAFSVEGSRIELLNDSLLSVTGVPSEAPSFVALAGDAIAVIADAYLRTGTTDSLVLGSAIADSKDVEAVTGSISYNGSGLPTKTIYVHQVVDGQATLSEAVG